VQTSHLKPIQNSALKSKIQKIVFDILKKLKLKLPLEVSMAEELINQYQINIRWPLTIKLYKLQNKAVLGKHFSHNCQKLSGSQILLKNPLGLL